jgi:dTDP-glucose 4,6-dehydratase
MRIIITGGSGFIGSNLILYLHGRYPDMQIMNLDKLTYASDPSYLAELKSSSRYYFKKLDLVHRDAVQDAVQTFKPDGVIHLAAESHVDNSIKGPEPFVQSNVVGTFNILDECRRFWMDSKEGLAHYRFHHVSTDEVYGSLGAEGYFTEETPFAPNSPYSATKAGSDMLVRAYYHTYGMNVVTTNCSNNYGRFQHDEKLIPTVIRNAYRKSPIPVYGKGENIRDWLHVSDHCSAIDLVYRNGKAGETYNVGGHNEWKNLDLVHSICSIMNDVVGDGPNGDYTNLIQFVTDRPGHDLRYAIDPTKIERDLGWRHQGSFEQHLRETILWYVEKYRSQDEASKQDGN